MKLTRSLCVFCLLLPCMGSSRAGITSEDIMAYWPIDGTLGDPLAGNHGVLRGTSLQRGFVDSPLGRGIRLDGRDQWIEMTEFWENMQALSVSMWVRHEGVAGTLLFRGDESWYLNVLADGNALPDVWEKKHGLGETIPGKAKADDTDGDGLNNGEEWTRGTDPAKPDSDGDGLPDGSETATSPVADDTDNDGLLDGQEAPLNLDPLRPDTDQDHYSDGDERKTGADPRDPMSLPDLASGLKAYWPFEGDFADAAGRYHGIPSSPNLQFTQGLVPGQALELKINQYVDVTGGGDFVFAGKSFSVSLWLEVEGTPDEEPGTFIPRNLLDASGPDPGAFQYDSQGWVLGMSFERNPAWGSTASTLRFTPGEVQKPRFALVRPPPEVVARHVLAVFDEKLPAATPAALYVNGEKLRFFRTTSTLTSPGNNKRSLRIGNGFRWSRFPGFLQLEDKPILTASLTEAQARILLRIDDVAIWNRALTESEAKALFAARQPISSLVDLDSDHDGMPTAWEKLHGLDLQTNDAAADRDGDGLTNTEEFQLGSHPVKSDTDADGADDKSETGTGEWFDLGDRGTNRLVADTDGDGLLDGAEIPDAVHHQRSDPNLMGTDSDGLDDGTEIQFGSHPAEALSLPPLAAGLIAHWLLDTDTLDRVGQRLAKPKLPVKFQPGNFGQGVSFDGLEQYLEVPDPAGDFNISKAGFSVSAWVRQEAYGADSLGLTSPGIVAKGGIFGWSLRGILEQDESATYPMFSMQSFPPFGGVRIESGFTRVALEHRLFHIAGVANHKTQQVLTYVDGDPADAKGNWLPNDTTAPLRIGTSGDPNSPFAGTNVYWKGVIDDLAIWRRVLTESEIRGIAQSGKSLSTLVPTLLPPVNADTDFDGMSDAAEKLAGTNPNDGSDLLRVLSISLTSGKATLTWTSVPGKRYVVEFTPALGTAGWRPLHFPIEATGRTLTSGHELEQEGGQPGGPPPAPYPQAFYRIRLAD